MSYDNNNLMSAGDAIRAFFKHYGLEDKIKEAKILSVCDKVLGPAIVRQVVKIYFRYGNLCIELKNAAMRQELEYNKTLMADNINQEMGERVVKSITLR